MALWETLIIILIVLTFLIEIFFIVLLWKKGAV